MTDRGIPTFEVDRAAVGAVTASLLANWVWPSVEIEPLNFRHREEFKPVQAAIKKLQGKAFAEAHALAVKFLDSPKRLTEDEIKLLRGALRDKSKPSDRWRIRGWHKGAARPDPGNKWDRGTSAALRRIMQFEVSQSIKDQAALVLNLYYLKYHSYILYGQNVDSGHGSFGKIPIRDNNAFVRWVNTKFVIRYKITKKTMEMERFHSEVGPALKTKEFELYALRGTFIPKEWITDKKALEANPEVLLRWANAEQRRVGLDFIGWHHVLDKLGATTVQKSKDPTIGTLLDVYLPPVIIGSGWNRRSEGGGTIRLLQVQCGTGRTFVIPVPRTCETALDANAWTYNVPTRVISQLEART